MQSNTKILTNLILVFLVSEVFCEDYIEHDIDPIYHRSLSFGQKGFFPYLNHYGYGRNLKYPYSSYTNYGNNFNGLGLNYGGFSPFNYAHNLEYGIGSDLGFGIYPYYSNYYNLGLGPLYGHDYPVVHYKGDVASSGFDKSRLLNNGINYKDASGLIKDYSNKEKDGFAISHDALKNNQHDAGFYSDTGDIRNGYENVNKLEGVEKSAQTGKNEEEIKAVIGRKKGHVTKGFEVSHHKDETGKTTTYYDESNNEKDHYGYGGQHKSFGSSQENLYKNGHEDSKLRNSQNVHKGEYDNVIKKDNENYDKLLYDNRNIHGNNHEFVDSIGSNKAIINDHNKHQLYNNYKPYSYY